VPSAFLTFLPKTQAARKEAALALMRDSASRAEAAGGDNAAALAALADQMSELRAAQLDWQQNVLSGRLAALRQDSDRIAANDRLKVVTNALQHRTLLMVPALDMRRWRCGRTLAASPPTTASR